MTRNILAIGRSRYLYDSICYLNQHGYSVSAIITDIAYDEYDVKHTDFETLAKETGAAFFLQSSLNEDLLKKLIEEYQVEVAISVNWKYKINLPVLQILRHGILNFHLGTLPDYKGNATVNWAILNGEDHIYGNVHRMEEDLDAGDVIVRTRFDITEDTYIKEVITASEKALPELYKKALDRIFTNPDFYELKGSKEGSRCYPRLPEDSLINWNRPAREVHRLVRASSQPFKGAYSFIDTQKIIIWKAKVVIPIHRFFAVPGHVVSVDKKSGAICVACQDAFLEITELEGAKGVERAASLVKSIRARFRDKPENPL